MAFPLLEYENEILLDLLHEDSLLLMAKGLGIHRILINLIKVFHADKFLVFVLLTSSSEQSYTLDTLHAELVEENRPMPKCITNEFSASKRSALYAKGGVFFITSRILLVDLLQKRLPQSPDLRSGILLFNCHKANCIEYFILRLFAKTYAQAFFKCLSDRVSPFIDFSSPLSGLSRRLKKLRVKNVMLWPRFHANVMQAFLEAKPVDVIEVRVTPSHSMFAIQQSITHLIAFCLREVKVWRNSVDILNKLSLEICLNPLQLNHFIKRHLQIPLSLLPQRFYAGIESLKTLSNLMSLLYRVDAGTFYAFVSIVFKQRKNASSLHSFWLFQDASDTFYEKVHQRKIQSSLFNEQNPKLKALSQILSEIERYENSLKEAEKDRITVEDSPTLLLKTCQKVILITCFDDKVCEQVVNFLSKNFNKKFAKKEDDLISAGFKSGESTKMAPNDKFKKFKSNFIPNPISSASVPTSSSGANLDQFVLGEDVDSNVSIVSSQCIIILQPLHANHEEDAYSVLRSLYELQPCYIIMLNPDIEFLRQVEVFKACRTDINIRLYFITYSDSNEEQMYLTNLRLEKEAFERIIQEKSELVLSRELTQISHVDELNPEMKFFLEVDDSVLGRTAGVRVSEEKDANKLVIVDMRELRCNLPCDLDEVGLDVMPLTIDIGDYLLTPKICVERKSITDLQHSLNSGRLYCQALAMTRSACYQHPCLLIENEQESRDISASASVINIQSGKKCMLMSSAVSLQEVQSKLVLLTLHFPTLRLLWSTGSSLSAQIFKELKENRPDPVIPDASLMHEDFSTKINANVCDILLKIPGITTHNYWKIIHNVKDLIHLACMSVQDLSDLMQSETTAKCIYNFFHTNIVFTSPSTSSVKPISNKRKFSRRKK